jgi:hypothetical protein
MNTPLEFWFDVSVKLVLEFWFLPYKILGSTSN